MPTSSILDIKITGGQILDGSGAPARRADVGIAGAQLVALGDLSGLAARQTIAAEGRYVCPGFIDSHSHSDAYLLIEPAAPSKIYQGITTEIVGNCGASAAPLADPACLPSDWQGLDYPGSWQTMADYLRLLEQVQPALNVAALVGHGKLRSWVMGYQARPATPAEIQAMCALLAESLQAGGWGLSSGLIYTPGKWATREELAALAAVVAKHQGIYVSHMRSESADLLQALEETIAIARATKVRVEVSHLKTAGPEAWPLVDAALAQLRQARADGLEIAADRYPYVASCTDLDVVLPGWATADGKEAILARLRDPHTRQRLCQEIFTTRKPQMIVIAGTSLRPCCGLPLLEVAAHLRLDPADAVLHLLDTDALQTSAFFLGMNEANMWRILAEPYVMLGTDASLQAPTGPLSQNYPHPRAYGSFPRFLRAALDGQTVPLPEAIRKMTSLPAQHFRVPERGLLAEGRLADVVIFNPDTLADLSTFAEPHQLARGIEWVIVNGAITLTPDGPSGVRAGRLLRRA